MAEGKYRLVTRSDFDGLVCAVLLKELDLIDEVTFAHPKDMQDGTVAITGRDIITNLPYVEGCYMTFDHHASEVTRLGKRDNLVIEADAPSAARVIWKHYGGKAKFLHVTDAMMEAVDRADSAQWSRDEVVKPTGWPLLSFIMDSRTGLGRFRDFRISNYQLMMALIDMIRRLPLAEILANPDVRERTELYFAQQAQFEAQLQRCGRQHGDVVVLDLREEETIYAGNRFLIYAVFPTAKVSIHVMWGREKKNVVLACGRSIFDRSSTADIGALMLKHGGGGHKAAGTCQVDVAVADKVLAEVTTGLQG